MEYSWTMWNVSRIEGHFDGKPVTVLDRPYSHICLGTRNSGTLPLPACGERVEVRGRFRDSEPPKHILCRSDSRRGPLTRIADAIRPLPARGER
jgi:hypothetical protein